MTMPIPECATPVSAPQPKEVNTRLPAIGRLSALPRPFLKWAGSKQGLLRHIVTAVPSTFGTYYEPFLGSGALFFHLSPEKAKISDSCAPLIQTYLSVRDNCAEVSRRIAKIKIDKDSYYRVRDIRFASDLERATYFIYLNKTCWNGLYRVNSRGEFNVPYGTPNGHTLVDAKNLFSCSTALSKAGVQITTGDFEETVEDAKENDFVFFDPPYVTKHNNNGFRDYNESLFSWSDQKRLAAIACKLRDKKVNVVITNADHEEVLALYPEFNIRHMDRHSTLASNASRRMAIREALIYTNDRGSNQNG